MSGGKLVPGPNSRGLIGGVASVIGQAVRGVPQGSEWETANPRHGDPYRYGDPYSRGYRGRGRRRGRDGPRDGLISTPVGAARKLLKQVGPFISLRSQVSTENCEEDASGAIERFGNADSVYRTYSISWWSTCPRKRRWRQL